MTTPLSSATRQFIMRNQHAFRHDTIGSMFVRRTIVTSLYIRASVAATPAGTLSDTRTQLGNTKAKKDQTEKRRTFQSLSYIPYSYLLSAQGPEYRQVEIARTQATCPTSNQPLS